MECEVVSMFFSDAAGQLTKSNTSEELLELIDELNGRLSQIQYPTQVECIYNPTIYARYTFELYIQKYCNTKKPIMYFGMNPGPWGMSQTGVPFGEISFVRDWLGIEGPVNKPPQEIPARPISGFKCTRSEISGKRFWGLFKDLCGTPEKFFETSFVYNYLPQQWLKNNGCNITPGDFKALEMKELYNVCDPIFSKVLQLYQVEKIVAIGRFCETRAQKAIKKYLPSSSIQILYMQHPSPRTVNNNNWDEKAIHFLRDANLLQYYKSEESNVNT